MIICENCIHKEVCGIEGYYEEALKFCANKVEDIQLDYYKKLIQDMNTIKDAVNDPNKNGFDVCRLIKSITDEYDFEEEEDG